MNLGGQRPNAVIVAQRGRIAFQALLSAASLRVHHSAEQLPIYICVPNNSSLWEQDPTIDDVDLIDAFKRYGCELVNFDNEHFGSVYPHSNKFYAIRSLPPEEPFLFLDSDTVLIRAIQPGDFDYENPGLKEAGPFWPVKRKSTFTVAEIWRSLYDLFELDAAPYFDETRGEDVFQCYPYYQGNVMYYARAGIFGQTMLDMGRRLWSEQPRQVQPQPLKPWLDQIVLPLVLAKLGAVRRSEGDPIREVISHYQFPMFLLRPDGRNKKYFGDVLKDPQLVSVLRRDKGFDYYLSDDGRAHFQKMRLEFESLGDKGRKKDQGKRKAFRDFVRARAPVLR